MKLLPRFLLILCIPMVCVQLILSYIFIEKHANEVLTISAQSIASDICVLSNLFNDGMNICELKKIAKNLNLDVEVTKKLCLERYGVHKNTWLYRFLKRAFQLKLQKPYFLKMVKKEITVNVVCKNAILAFNIPTKRFFTQTMLFVVFGTFISSIFLFVIAFLFMKNQIRSIVRLTKVVEQLGLGEDPKGFRPEGALEVKRAGYAFLKMKERIQRHLSSRMEMLLGISHDLRTPITRMKLQIACLEPSNALKEIEFDINQMQKMIESFLSYAKNDQIEEFEECSIKTLILECIKSVSPFSVTIICNDDWFIQTKPLTFKRSLINILLNSKKFANSAIIKVIMESRFIKIIIDDDGPGIPKEEREHVFKPFYRTDSSRNLDFGGVGLGLSIVQDAISSLGGRVKLTDVSNKNSNDFLKKNTQNSEYKCSNKIGKGLRVIFFIPKFERNLKNV